MKATSAACALASLCAMHCADDVTRYVGPREQAVGRPPDTLENASHAGPHCDAEAPPGCSVSFARDLHAGVFTRLSCMAKTCHAAGAFAPRIDPANATAARASLATYVLAVDRTSPAPRPYVNACARDASASSILCNLQGTCGTRMPQGGTATASDLDLLARWLACGAPDN